MNAAVMVLALIGLLVLGGSVAVVLVLAVDWALDWWQLRRARALVRRTREDRR